MEEGSEQGISHPIAHRARVGLEGVSVDAVTDIKVQDIQS